MMQACYTCNKLFSDEYALAQHRCSSAAQPDPKDSARVREPGAVTPHLKPEVVFGVKTYSDPSLPPGEIHIRLDGKTVGRIINVGPDARITQPERDHLQARVADLVEERRDRAKQHQEDARLWQMERDHLQACVAELTTQAAEVTTLRAELSAAESRLAEYESTGDGAIALVRGRDAARAESNKLDSELGSALAENQRLEAASARMREALERETYRCVDMGGGPCNRCQALAYDQATKTGGKDGG